MTEPLLTPCSLGTCQIANRFVMTAASLCRCPDGQIQKETIDFYQARAKGGVGLLIAGAAGVDPTRRSRSGMMQVCDDTFLPGLRNLTDAVHQEGGKIFLQLLHPGAYASPSEYGETPPIAPSAYISGLTGVQTVEMSPEQINEIIRYFAEAAARTQKAGFDGVELCASVGYLIAEFLSSATNHRTDCYGGSLENRMRFLLEIVDAVKEATGNEFPLMVRLSGADLIPNGNTLEDTICIASALEEHGVHAISVTGGWHESRIPQITAHVPHGAYRFYARAIKQQVSIPVIACNRMDLPTGRQALQQGDCDLIGMCRPFLADPQLVRKFQQGRTREIYHCLSCNQECLDRVFGGAPVSCTINPLLGQELQPMACRDHGKKILVVGAGISGLTYAAHAAAENQITVWEKSGDFGGAGRLLAQLPHWEDSAAYLDALYQTCIRQGVPFCWHQSADMDCLKNLLQSHTYDKIILATGAQLKEPDFPIEEGAPVCSIQEFIEQDLPLAPHTVIIGNDFRALEFALLCAKKATSPTLESAFYPQWFPPFPSPNNNASPPSVTCVGPHRKPGAGMAKSVLWATLKEAKAAQLTTICEASVREVSCSEVLIEHNGQTQSLPADLVILAHRWKASPLSQELALWPEELQARVTIVGDAKAPARITQAVQTAISAAVHLPELLRKENAL